MQFRVMGLCYMMLDFQPEYTLKFQSYNCLSCGQSGYFKSEKGHNSEQMQIRVMGLCYIVLHFHPEHLFDVSKLNLS